MSNNQSFEIYTGLLPIFLIPTTIFGIISGYRASKKVNSNELFINMIGYSSIGIFTGFAYPIVYPMTGCYILYRNIKF